MADYGVNIKVAVQNTQKIQDLTNQLKRTGAAVDQQNKALAKMAGKTEEVIGNVKNLNAILQESRENFNKAVLGTKSFITASRDLVAINREVTRSLEQRAAALERIQSGKAADPTSMGSASSQRQSQFAKLEEIRRRAVRASNRDVQQKIGEQASLERTKAQKSLEIEKRAAQFRLGQAKKEQELEQTKAQKSLQIKKRAAQFRLGQAKKEREFERSLQRIGLARKKQQFEMKSEQKRLQKALGAMDKKSERIDKNRLELQQKSLRLGKQRVRNTTNAVLENKKLTKEQQKQLALRRQQSRQKVGGAISSGLIGGGFPLLFGQGGASAVGGAIGGVAGGAIGSGFGFAMSIVGTAIGQAITEAEKFDKALAAVNAKAVNLGSATQASAEDVKNLAKQLGITKDEALELVNGFSAFESFADKQALAAIFGDDSAALGRLAGAKTELDLAKEIFDSRQKIGNIKAKELINTLRTADASVVELALAEARLQAEHGVSVEKAKQITFMDRLNAGINQQDPFFLGALSGELGPTDPAQFGEDRAKALEETFLSNRGDFLETFKKLLKERRELLKDVAFFDSGSGKADPTVNLQKRLNILNKQISSEQKFVGVSSEGASIIRRKLALESKIAQIQETGRAERKRLTEQEDISLSKSIEKKAVDLETLKFEREVTALIERQSKAGEKLLEPLQKRLDAIKDRNAFEKEYGDLIMSGSTPAAAKQVIEAKKQIKEIERLVEKQLESNKILIANLEIAVDQAKTTEARVAAEDALNRALQRRNEIEEKGRIAKGEVKGEKTPAERFNDEIKAIQGIINELNDPVRQAIELSRTLGSAFSESFKGIVSGSMSAQQALANLFQRTADHFLDMAAQMIAAQIRMQAVNLFMSFFPGGGGGTTGLSDLNAPASINNPLGIMPKALGGPVSRNQPYLVGERGPEMFVPGAQGNIVPNNAMGGGASVTVNVDASGSSVEGDGNQAAQLGKAIGIAVQQELIKQKRPGGLLTR